METSAVKGEGLFEGFDWCGGGGGVQRGGEGWCGRGGGRRPSRRPVDVSACVTPPTRTQARFCDSRERQVV